MSRQVNIYEAKTHLSKLVDEAAAGEEIVIAKNGKPKARLSPIEAPKKKEPRKLGQWAVRDQDINWDTWWREWKAADKEIEADFEAAIAKPFPGESDNTPRAASGSAGSRGRGGFAEGDRPSLADAKRAKGRARSPASKIKRPRRR